MTRQIKDEAIIGSGGGGGGNFIPLTGTAIGQPVTGNIEMDDCGISVSGIASGPDAYHPVSIAYGTGSYTNSGTPAYDCTSKVSLQTDGRNSGLYLNATGGSGYGENSIYMKGWHDRLVMADYGGSYNTSPTVRWTAFRGTQGATESLQQYDQEGLFIWSAGIGGADASQAVANAYMFGELIDPGGDSNPFGAALKVSTCPNNTATPIETFAVSAQFGLQMFGANTVIDTDRLFKPRSYTVATLPDPTVSLSGIAAVSDATQAAGTSIGSAPTGSGSNYRIVYIDTNATEWLLL